MSTVEQDVERVRAVHAALGAPPEVWAAKYQNRHGEGFVLFASEASARNQLLEWLREEKEGLSWSQEDFDVTFSSIADGKSDEFNDEGDRWYSIEQETVHL